MVQTSRIENIMSPSNALAWDFWVNMETGYLSNVKLVVYCDWNSKWSLFFNFIPFYLELRNSNNPPMGKNKLAKIINNISFLPSLSYSQLSKITTFRVTKCLLTSQFVHKLPCTHCSKRDFYWHDTYTTTSFTGIENLHNKKNTVFANKFLLSYSI